MAIVFAGSVAEFRNLNPVNAGESVAGERNARGVGVHADETGERGVAACAPANDSVEKNACAAAWIEDGRAGRRRSVSKQLLDH